MGISKSRQTALVAVVTIVVLAAASSVVWAGPRGHGQWRGEGPGGDHAGRMMEMLDLTPEQREQVKAIHESHRERHQGVREQLQQARRALADQIHAEIFDEAAIREAAAGVAAVEADVAVHRALVMKEIGQVLTPQQREELEQLRKKHREFVEEHDGPGPHRGHRGHGMGRRGAS